MFGKATFPIGVALMAVYAGFHWLAAATALAGL
jgi:hypothetical protein